MKVNIYRSVLDRDGYVSVVADGKVVCDGRKQFANADTIIDVCRKSLGMDGFAEEHVYAFALNNKLHLMGAFALSSGSVALSVIPIRETFQKLLALNAVTFVLVHNHPSGDPTPSDYDDEVTKRMIKCGKLLGITLTDHIVLGNYGAHFSYREERRELWESE